MYVCMYVCMCPSSMMHNERVIHVEVEKSMHGSMCEGEILEYIRGIMSTIQQANDAMTCVFILKTHHTNGGCIKFNYTYHACINWL